MKKTLITAGAASLALAAMPVMGVFATNGSVDNNGTLTDTLVLTIGDNCKFSRGTVADASSKHTVKSTEPAPDTTITNGGWTTDGTNTDKDVFTAAVMNGESYTGIATSNFKVVCNNLNGYQVTVAPTDFSTSNISGAATWSYSTTGTYAAGDVSSWYITSDGEGQAMTGNSPKVATKSTATAGSDITVTYNVKVSSTQQAATYSADAVYTFAKLPVSQP